MITSERRRKRVEQVFDDLGWDNLADIDEWDGEDLEDLREMLSEEQFEALLDRIGAADEERR